MVTTREKAKKLLKQLIADAVLYGTPIGGVIAATEYLFHERFYTILAGAFATIVIYLIWLDIRVRNLEKRK